MGGFDPPDKRTPGRKSRDPGRPIHLKPAFLKSKRTWFVSSRGKRMNSGKVRTIHRRLGITIVALLLVQAMAGALMSIERLAALENSKPYNILYTIHADWDPPGSIYRVILGLATCLQGILGIMIFRNRIRFRTGDNASPTIPPDRSDQSKNRGSPGSLSFAGDIRPLFRDRDIAAMKPNGVDLASYEGVKKHARDIHARLSAKEMPCDGPWSAKNIERFKEWIETGMEP